MKIFDFYLFRHLAIATIFIAIVLTFIIFLTQSLKFLEIVINAGSSGSTFWLITSLALPRFFEVIMPLSLMASTLFLYNKMTIDSEIIAMRGMGHSPLSLSKPALTLGGLVTLILWLITFWLAPLSLAKMQDMRTELKAEFSNFLFREGVFNKVGSGLTVYISKRDAKGELYGLMIHDTRDKSKPPSTVLAQRGLIVVSDDGHQVIVFDGSRQQYNPQSEILQKLAFDRYTIDLPENAVTKTRWAQPDERTLGQLLTPDMNNDRDVENLREFSVEVHRRVASPLLSLAFVLIALVALLLGPFERRGQSRRIGAAIISVIIIQGLFLTAYNMARNHDLGLVLMYVLTLSPIGICAFFISGVGEKTRRKILYKSRQVSA